jgi:hypothetical protein
MKYFKILSIKAFIYSLVIFQFHSCYVLHYPISEEEIQNAKNMAVPEGKSLLYIYRNSNKFIRPDDSLDVVINKTHLPPLLISEFYLCILDSGKYVVKGFTEEDEIKVYSVPGEKYYIQASPIARFSDTGCRLELQTIKTGTDEVMKCNLLGVATSKDLLEKKSISRLPWEKMSVSEYKALVKQRKNNLKN